MRKIWYDIYIKPHAHDSTAEVDYGKAQRLVCIHTGRSCFRRGRGGARIVRRTVPAYNAILGAALASAGAALMYLGRRIRRRRLEDPAYCPELDAGLRDFAAARKAAAAGGNPESMDAPALGRIVFMQAKVQAQMLANSRSARRRRISAICAATPRPTPSISAYPPRFWTGIFRQGGQTP